MYLYKVVNKLEYSQLFFHSDIFFNCLIIETSKRDYCFSEVDINSNNKFIKYVML